MYDTTPEIDKIRAALDIPDLVTGHVIVPNLDARQRHFFDEAKYLTAFSEIAFHQTKGTGVPGIAAAISGIWEELYGNEIIDSDITQRFIDLSEPDTLGQLTLADGISLLHTLARFYEGEPINTEGIFIPGYD